LGWSALRLALGVLLAWLSRTVHSGVGLPAQGKPRGQTEVTTVHYTSKDWKILFRSAPLRWHYLGYALFGLAANNLSIWARRFLCGAQV